MVRLEHTKPSLSKKRLVNRAEEGPFVLLLFALVYLVLGLEAP